jgi:5S rRNA maturation endonuclease (ribonuclease M5)
MPDHRIEGVGEVDAEDLLDMLGADNVHDVGSEEVGFSCFYVAGHANGDQNPSAHLNRDALVWRCKGCGRSGNVVELVRLALPHGTTFPEATAWLREHFGEVVRAPRGGSLGADLDSRLAKPDVVVKRLPVEAETIGTQGIFHLDWSSDHEAAVYMRGRGFAPEVLEDWQVGYDHWTRRVAIPVRDEEGVLVGFKGRTLEEDTKLRKYLLLGDKEGRLPRFGVGYGFDMHDPTSVVFGLDRAEESDTVVLCEGEFDAIACHAAGITNALAVGTTSITDQQLWLLRAHASALILFYDSDKAGVEAVHNLIKRIYPYFRLYLCNKHKGDAASMGPERVRQVVGCATYWLAHVVPSGGSV